MIIRISSVGPTRKEFRRIPVSADIFYMKWEKKK